MFLSTFWKFIVNRLGVIVNLLAVKCIIKQGVKNVILAVTVGVVGFCLVLFLGCCWGKGRFSEKLPR